MSNHLIIGDAHAKPDTDLSRFDWLAKYVLDTKPDVIVDMGDWEDMPSLSSYDKGTKSYEGRRYKRDIEAAWEARELFSGPIRSFNESQRINKKKQYNPKMVRLGNNHFERRVKRTLEFSPELIGVISEQDHRASEWGWYSTGFLEPITIDGFTYSHYFQGNGTPNPIGMGKFPASVLLRERHSSCVMGHNHMLDVATDLNGREERIWTFSAGCFFDQFEEYAGRNNYRWWRGILILKDVKDGDISGYETISIDKLKELYS